MEDLYRGAWADQDCVTALWQVALIILAVMIGTFALIAGLAWPHIRRASPADRRVVLWLFGGVGTFLVVPMAYALVSDPVLRQVTLHPPLLTVRWCYGLTEHVASRPLDQIADVRHRTYSTGGKSKRIEDELVITFQDGEVLNVRLSTDPETTNRNALRAVAPREVIEQWIASLRERRVSVPEGL